MLAATTPLRSLVLTSVSDTLTNYQRRTNTIDTKCQKTINLHGMNLFSSSNHKDGCFAHWFHDEKILYKLLYAKLFIS